jgi:hypothetical protein
MRNAIVTCPCGQKNRVPAIWRAGQRLRCGRCKHALALNDEAGAHVGYDDDDDDDEEDDE